MRTPDQLRPYQQRIITHLYQNDEALCVVRMGGGKTIAALTAIQELQRDKVISHALVIAPKRVANVVWPEEILAWEHTRGKLIETVLEGSPERRRCHLAAIRAGDLTIIGLDLVGWLFEQIENYPDDHRIFDLLVIDEISKLRDPTGVRSKLLAKNAHRWKMIWGLSGTLRPNSAMDLFAPARIVTRGKLWGRSFYQWRKERFYPTDYKGYTWEPLPGAEDKINEEIAPLTVTLHDDELPQLPKLSVILDRVELPDRAKQTYRSMHRRLFASVKDASVLAANAAVATGKLAQIANGFIYEGEDERRVLAIHDEKRAWLADLVEQATSPMLLIYEYQEDLRLLQDVCGAALPYLGGGIPDHRGVQFIKDWNDGKLPFLGLHPRSGGHGLNLQAGGSDMAWVAPTWSPELWEQTIARIYRSGQDHPVMVRVCVATGTVDEMKLERVYYKISEQKAFERYLAMFEEGIGTT